MYTGVGSVIERDPESLLAHPYRRSHCQVARIPAPAVKLPGLTALLATEAD